MVGEWLEILLRRTSHKAPVGGAWLGHSLRVGAACASLAVGASLMQIMHYGLWKSLAAVQRYLEHFDAISPDSSAWLFFGWMTPPIPPPRTLSAFNSPGAPAVLQAQPQSVSPAIDLDEALERCSTSMLDITLDRRRVFSTCASWVILLHTIPSISMQYMI